jgi:uncharacterized protein YyaL (SSP411 family)
LNVLRVQRTPQAVAEELGVSIADLQASLARARPTLYAARRRRVPPLLDDKVLVAWNGLMIESMAVAARIWPERGYAQSAERAADFLLTRLTRTDGGLLRTYRAGKAHLDAYLEDYAYLAQGLVSLYEATGSERWLREAARLAQRMIDDFGDPEGGPFYQTAHGHEALIARVRDGHDGAIPNANALAAFALARLSRHLAKPEWEERARQALRGYAASVQRLPRAFGSTLNALDFLDEPSLELALAGTAETPGYAELAAAIAEPYLPNRIEARVTGPSSLPLAEGKTLADGHAALYVCRNFTCAAPVATAAAARALLSRP